MGRCGIKSLMALCRRKPNAHLIHPLSITIWLPGARRLTAILPCRFACCGITAAMSGLVRALHRASVHDVIAVYSCQFFLSNSVARTGFARSTGRITDYYPMVITWMGRPTVPRPHRNGEKNSILMHV